MTTDEAKADVAALIAVLARNRVAVEDSLRRAGYPALWPNLHAKLARLSAWTTSRDDDQVRGV